MGIRTEKSFHIHLPASVAVVALALVLRLDPIRLSVLFLCISTVISAEVFNSSLERLAKAITHKQDNNIGTALDIASGAVLVVSIFSALVGFILLGPPLFEFFGAN